MYGVARLYSLRILNLSHNNIVSIEGLKDMKYLSHLNLAGNNIKNIEHLNANLMLEHLDLSDNAITTIPDLSSMKLLRRLHLHSNRIKTLQFCEKFLPPSITTLTLSDNAVSDLNEISRLAHLVYLEVFSISGNPCCLSGDGCRPFMLNWLPSLKILDETLVSAKESLVAEWLFSLGRGRQFKVGQHDELIAYLASIRPDVGCGTNGQPEEGSGKLDKILSLARQNHCDLQQAVSATSSPTPTRRSVSSASSSAKKPIPSRKQVTPPRDSAKPSRSSTASKPPAYEDDLTLEPMPALMCQSLDPSAANLALERSASVNQVPTRPARPVSAQHFGDEDDANEVQSNLRRAASAAQVRKPLYSRSTSQQPQIRLKTASKLPVQTRKIVPSPSVAPPSRPAPKLSEAQAAVTIQKVWRGYQIRNLDPTVGRLKNHLRMSRAEEHVEHLSRELARTRELDRRSTPNGQAVPADGMPPTEDLASLSEAYSRLQRQVNDLQQSMQQVFDWINNSQPVPRPRTLPLTSKSAPSVQQPVESFAQGMADRLIQSVSEPGSAQQP